MQNQADAHKANRKIPNSTFANPSLSSKVSLKIISSTTRLKRKKPKTKCSMSPLVYQTGKIVFAFRAIRNNRAIISITFMLLFLYLTLTQTHNNAHMMQG